ncbi:hypothetical protein SeMB42_g05602 [Synchytrium endobioticum]|uniref:Indoleamine 2,3-dioxygenase n=1 Tax=Synchytrium endobioticum TaxID=286115 RepID=A0A507DIX3_9FUNG|nr:hypothetical protein SeMB42_g05602 [Synchytrium endobioticum]TPX51167.1 hypothetical protein SeLEV6574_g00414 [Synchytrium endobioticum]
MAVREGAIPNPEHYDISLQTGFLPSSPFPLRRLPPYFHPWEVILDKLSVLLLAGRIREYVQKLPVLDAKKLGHHTEWRRAYLVLSFLAQAYVWGKNEDAQEVLPECIAVPWVTVCNQLGLKPVISYAAVELYNYYLIDENGPMDLSNLAVMHTFSGGMDEAWFYLVSIAIEAAGAPAIPAIINAMHAVVNRDIPSLESNLNIIASSIERIIETLVAMYEKNDPHIFFHRVRPYVAGWEHTPELPFGLFYEGVVIDFDEKSRNSVQKENSFDGSSAPNGTVPNLPTQLPRQSFRSSTIPYGTSTFYHHGHIHSSKHRKPIPPPDTPRHEDHGVVGWVKETQNINGTPINIQPPSPHMIGTWGKWAGASAGQSSLIHALDVALDIEHLPTRPAAPPGSTGDGLVPEKDPGTVSLSSLRTATGHYYQHSHRPFTASSSNSSTTNNSSIYRHMTGLAHPAKALDPHTANAINHIHEMRKYMPGAHRDFIYALGRAPSIRSFIQELRAYTSMGTEAERLYNQCVEGLRVFRDIHFKMVTVYIVIQASKKKEAGIGSRPNPVHSSAGPGSGGSGSGATAGSSTRHLSTGAASGVGERVSTNADTGNGSDVKSVQENASLRVRQTLIARGTGGTDLVPFLKQSRAETAQAHLGSS